MSWTGARWVAIVLLLVSSGADAAFFYSHTGQVANLAPQVAYRIEDPKSPQSFDQVSRETQGWVFAGFAILGIVVQSGMARAAREKAERRQE